MFSSQLYRSIINDRMENPERFNATFERVEEVLQVVLGDRAGAVIDECARGIKEKRALLDDERGKYITGIIGNSCSFGEISQMTLMLMDSPVSTQEAIDLHEEYKIPVSHLEKDIIPVRGDGAWVIDTRGRAFLDMDSNYSATNLGMNNPEIARGLYNQARRLISMKEDRVHIARAQFLKHIQPWTRR